MAKREMPSVKALESQYPGNSYAQRNAMDDNAKDDIQERPRPKQVAQAKTRKQGIFRKFANYILEDTVESARERAFSDIIRPGIKSLLYDTATELLSIMIYGNSDRVPRGSQRRSARPLAERTSYASYYESSAHRNRARVSYRDIPQDPDDIILDTYKEANDALRTLDDYIHRYGQASIADLYDCVGISSSWPDNRYGWLSIRGATVRPVREGYMLVMPPTQVLA